MPSVRSVHARSAAAELPIHNAMSRAPSDTSTVLRTRYLCARAMDLEAQTRDCIAYLQNPEVLVAALADAYLAIDLAYTPPPPREDGE